MCYIELLIIRYLVCSFIRDCQIILFSSKSANERPSSSTYCNLFFFAKFTKHSEENIGQKTPIFKTRYFLLNYLIRMSHWRHTMVDGAEFWISCQQLRILRKASHWQLIQNLTPSTIVWCQCDIRIIQLGPAEAQDLVTSVKKNPCTSHTTRCQ